MRQNFQAEAQDRLVVDRLVLQRHDHVVASQARPRARTAREHFLDHQPGGPRQVGEDAQPLDGCVQLGTLVMGPFGRTTAGAFYGIALAFTLLFVLVARQVLRRALLGDRV